jgi:hypothetical protein
MNFLVDCKKTFFILEEFNAHLQEESDVTNESETKNIICLEISKLQEQMCNDVTEYGAYKCLFDDCEDGFNDIGEKIFFNRAHGEFLTLQIISDLMRAHLSVVHPSKFAFVGERKNENIFIDLDNPSKSVVQKTRVIDLVDKKSDKHIKVRLWDKLKPLPNSEKISVIKQEVGVKPLTILNAYSMARLQN